MLPIFLSESSVKLENISFAGLDALANRFACRLRHFGVYPGAVVAIIFGLELQSSHLQTCASPQKALQYHPRDKREGDSVVVENGVVAARLARSFHVFGPKEEDSPHLLTPTSLMAHQFFSNSHPVKRRKISCQYAHRSLSTLLLGIQYMGQLLVTDTPRKHAGKVRDTSWMLPRPALHLS